jgi:predicted acyltransferase
MATLDAGVRISGAEESRAIDANPPAATDRMLSIDAFRGFTMICMVGSGFGLAYFANSAVLGPVARQFQHVDWQGMHFWDLIQPFFMFIVGAVMPISFARRRAAGEAWVTSLRHVLRRCFLLLMWGMIARSISANRPNLDLINVLGQLSFTYLVAFLVLEKSWRVQGSVALALLAAHWAIYQYFQPWGVIGPYAKDANIGWYLDRLILHKNWGGSYATINCLSSAANTIFGVMTGALLISRLDVRRKLRVLIGCGVAGIAVGLALSPWIPIIKKIWTASFAIYSAGWTLLALALFYWICDVRLKRDWTKLFVIVGMNSIFIYLFHEILGSWLNRAGFVFTKWMVDLGGEQWRAVNVLLVVAFQIWVCVWLYRRRIFFKL